MFAVQSYHFHLHMRIAEATRCRPLAKLIEQTHVLMFNWVWDLAARRPALPPRFHRDLIDALVATNPTESDAAMRRHIRHGLEGIIRAIADPAAGEGDVGGTRRPAYKPTLDTRLEGRYTRLSLTYQ